MAVVLAVLVGEHERADFAPELSAEESFVDVAELADLERGIVNGIVGEDALLLRAAARGRLCEDELAQHAGERRIGDAPFLDEARGGAVGGEEAAVVARDVTSLVEPFVLPVNEDEELQQVFVQIGERIVAELCRHRLERLDEALERKLFLVVLVAARRTRAHREQVAALRVEDEKQAVEKEEAGFVECAVFQLFVGDAVRRVVREGCGQFLQHVEDAAAEVFFEDGLERERFALDVIERAATVRASDEGTRRKERDEK